MQEIPQDWEEELSRFMTRLASLLLREATICPFCEGEVSSLFENGPCIYALPCHHRIIQGRLPDVWKTDPENEEEETDKE